MEEYKMSCVMSYTVRVSDKDARRIQEDPLDYMKHAISTGSASIEGNVEFLPLPKDSSSQKGSEPS